MDALEFLNSGQTTSQGRGSALDFLSGTSVPERTFKMKALDFLTMGHIYGEEGPQNELTPEGKLDPRVQSGDPGFFQDPVTALAMGGVAGVRAAGGLVGKGLAAGREALGWFTGGGSEVPSMVKGGVKTAVRAAEAKPLAELAAKRAGVQFAEVPIKMKAEEFLTAPASKIAAEVAPRITPAEIIQPGATSGGKQQIKVFHQSDTGELKLGKDVYGLGEGYFVSSKKLPKGFYGKKDTIQYLNPETRLFDFQQWAKDNNRKLMVPTEARARIINEAKDIAKNEGYDGIQIMPDDIWVFDKKSFTSPSPLPEAGAKVTLAPDTEFALYEMRSQLQSGEAGGLKGFNEGTGEAINMASGYPEWFTSMVKRFNDPQTSPLVGKVGISAKEVISILNKKLDGKPLTWKQETLYNDIERSAQNEISRGSLKDITADYMRELKKGETADGWTKANLESSQIKGSEILDNQEHLKARILDEVKREGIIDPDREAEALKELDNFFTTKKLLKTNETADLAGMSAAETFGLSAPELKKDTGVLTKNVSKARSADIFANESGAIDPNLLTLGTTKFLQDDVIPTSKSLYNVMKQSGKDIRNAFSPVSAGEGAQATAGIMRTNLAEMARSTDQAQFALKKARNYFVAKDPQFNYDFINKIETGANHPDIFLNETAKTMRDLLDKKAAEVQSLGTGKLESLIEDYFPHMWADPKKANEAFQNWYAKRPMEGSKSFLKQRTIPTTKEGLEMGLVPISDNPVDLTILKLREMDKYIMAQKTLKSMKDQGIATFVRSGHKPPDGMVPINDKIAKVYVSTEKYGKFVNEESITRDISHVNKILKETSKTETTGGVAGTKADALIEGRVLEALRSRGWSEGEVQQILSRVKAAPAGGEKTITIDKTTESIINTMVTHRIEKGFIPGKGFVNTGNYYAPADAARIVNNYLSPGLRGNQGFRAYLGAANVLNQAQLGLSAFHLGFTSVDAMVSKMALAMNQGVHGAFGQAAKSLVEVPVSPVSNIIRGNKLYKEWMMPGTQDAGIGKLVDAVVTAGGRAKMDKFYATEYAQKAADAFRKGNILGGLVRTPFALVDLAAKPIMEYIVPRQKLGVFADLARYELERLGKTGASEKEIQTALGKVWDSVDNRMGQLVYDNLFWNKMGKDLGMASVRSLGWNLGTIREIGGGGIDLLKAVGKVAQGKSPEMTYKMAYTASLPIVTGMMGGTLNYLMTGEPPKELKDYYFPRTGQLDETGKPARLSLPSYIKDLVHYYEQPVKTVTNKLHPALSMIGQMLANEDFYGVQIADWSDGVMATLSDPKTYKDYGEYLGKSVQPFGIRNLMRERQLGGTVVDQALPFIGLTPAPAVISKSKAENMMSEFLRGRIPNAAITKEQAEIHDTKRQILTSIRQGKAIDPDVARKLQNFSSRQLDNLMADTGKDYFEKRFKSLTMREALEVYNVGTPKEKEQAMPFLVDKIQANLGSNPEQIKKLLPKINKVFGIK